MALWRHRATRSPSTWAPVRLRARSPAGRARLPATPVAIIENGTARRTGSTGRLADLTRLAAAHTRGDAGPSLIIVGEVAALAAPPSNSLWQGVLMAKNLSGDLVASANRLVDGVVVFLDDAGQWTTRFERAAVARDKRAARSCWSAPAPRPSA